MSESQRMNKQMLEIWENYLELCSIFNDKLEEIQADDILNINLQLLKASITDLSINLSVFKNEMQKYNDVKLLEKASENQENQTHQKTQNNNQINNDTELDEQNLLSLFFLYLMNIDKDSIINKSYKIINKANESSNAFSNTISNTTSEMLNNSSKINNEKKVYDEPELD
jgi:hypothetical protein